MNNTSGLRLFVSRSVYPILVIAGDLVAFYLSLWISYVFRTGLFERWFPLPFSLSFYDLIARLWMPLVVIVAFAYEGLYTKRKPFWEETRNVVRATFLSYLTIFSIISLGKLSGEISRAVIVGSGILMVELVPLIRLRWKPFLHRLGIGVKKTILIGDNPVGRLAHLGLFRDHYMGIRIVGFLQAPSYIEKLPFKEELIWKENNPTIGHNLPVPSLSCLGTIKELKEIVRKETIRGAVIAVPHLRREDLVPLIEQVQRFVLSVYVVPNVSQVNLLNSELLYLFYEEMFLLGIHNSLKSRVNRWMKSTFDVTVAFFLFIPLAPLLLGIGALVALSSPGPVLFTQIRVGRGGKLFRIYKFRTMYEGAERTLKKLLAENPDLAEEYQKHRKLRNDPRITPIGIFLRRTSLDELPQLLNVLKGEMSLVGPRPALKEEIRHHYGGLESEYGLVKPGITGLWQVSGRNNNDFSMRVRLDLWYIRNWSLWLDLVILIRTMGVVLWRGGAF